MSLKEWRAERELEAEKASADYTKAHQDGNTVAMITALNRWAKLTGNTVLLSMNTYGVVGANAVPTKTPD